jgi:hypothetical protein
MIPIRVHRRLLALAAALCPILAFACGRVPGQFEILNNQVPVTAGGGCTIPVNEGVYSGKGTLDLSIVRSDFSTAYFVFPLIENNLPPSAGSGIDPNQIQLSGFNIDIGTIGVVPDSVAAVLQGSSLLHYQTPWSGGIDSGGGKVSASVEAFPVALAQQLLASGGFGEEPSVVFKLKIQALGTTNSGRSLQSDPFDYPVEVCAGCLVAGRAPCTSAAAPANPGNGCNPAQDEPVDCCTDNGVLVCPARPASP